MIILNDPRDPEVYREMVDWVRAAHPDLRYIMIKYPPCCTVVSTPGRRLSVPSPGQWGTVTSYITREGENPVLTVASDEGRGVCDPSWVRVVGYHDLITPKWVEAILNGDN